MPPAPTAADQFQALSNKLTVDIFIDATLSMKGFVTTGAQSYYQQTLPILESAVTEGWTGGQAVFYKFGTQIKPTDGREHLAAAKSEFYADKEINLKTYIEKVLDQAQPGHLTVIVTDLFQDNNDVNQLSAKLKEKFISKNKAVGVYAVRSEFNGVIYDVGTTGLKIPYQSAVNDAASLRPFYIVALGSHADVAHYFDILGRNGFNNFPAKNAVIFSRYLGSPLVPFKNAEVIDTDKLSELSATLIPQSNAEERVKDFKIVGRPDKAGFTVKFKYEKLPLTVDFAPNLTADVTAWKCEPDENKPKNEPFLRRENSEARPAFEIKSPVLKTNEQKVTELQFTGEVNPASLPGAGIYAFRITLKPQQYSLPKWIEEWDMNAKQLPQNFDGSKTYNLNNFLRNIWETTRSVHQPKLAEVYCYLQRTN